MFYDFTMREEFAKDATKAQMLFFRTGNQRDVGRTAHVGTSSIGSSTRQKFDGPSRTLVNLYFVPQRPHAPAPRPPLSGVDRGTHVRLYEAEEVTRDIGLQLRDCMSDDSQMFASAALLARHAKAEGTTPPP
jgi:hypothetical protein